MISFLLSVRLFFRYALVFLYLGCLVVLSLVPPKSLPKIPLFAGADKLIHLGMYLIFAVLSAWALRIERYRWRVMLIIPVTIGWGILMEYVQLAMGRGRAFSWYDILANSIGVITGVLFYVLVSRTASKHQGTV